MSERRILISALIVGATVATAAAGPAGGQSVQYRSPAGVAYRSQVDTGAIARAETALAAEPRNVGLIIQLGVAQSGARKFREAIETFTRGLALEPSNAMLLRWRGHRYLSVREFDRATDDLTRGSRLDSTIYGIWYHLGIVRYARGEFAGAVEAFKRAQPRAPDAAELAGATDWLWMSMMRAGRRAQAEAMLGRRPDSIHATNAYARRLKLYREEISPEEVMTPTDTADVQVATLSYGVGNWYLVRGETSRAREWFERSIRSGGWPAFGFILSEIELRRMGSPPAAGARGEAVSSSPSSSPPFPPPGRLIDLGGWRLHINCTGEKKPSQPIVILEAGVGDFSVEWSLVQPRVAAFARVCSYDRAGDGWSDLGPRPRTMRQINWEIRTLLEKAGERGPYVLVGHSWGGILARQYAFTYPSDVAGVVLVESGHENGIYTMVEGKGVRLMDMATGKPVPPVKTSDPVREGDIPPAARAQIEAAARRFSPRANEPPRDKLPPDAQRMRTWVLSQIKHWASNDNPFDSEELAALSVATKKDHSLGDIPLIVLSRGTADENADSEVQHRMNQTSLVSLSRNTRQIIAPYSGHHIQIDEPGLVVSSIREMLAIAR